MLLNICPGCMERIADSGYCPHCKQRTNTWQNLPHQLKVHTVLNGRYLTGAVLSESSTSIYYSGLDMQTGDKVSISEYFPSSIARRSLCSCTVEFETEPQLKDCLERADKLSALKTVPDPLRIRDRFKANNTVYIIWSELWEHSLSRYLDDRGGKIGLRDAISLLGQAIRTADSISQISGLGCGSISCDDIFICSGGYVVLVGWCFRDGHSREDSSAASVIYRCITGSTPKSIDAVLPSRLGAVIPQRDEAVIVSYINGKAQYGTLLDFYQRLTAEPVQTPLLSEITTARPAVNEPPISTPLAEPALPAESTVVQIASENTPAPALPASDEVQPDNTSSISHVYAMQPAALIRRSTKLRKAKASTALMLLAFLGLASMLLRHYSLNAMKRYVEQLLANGPCESEQVNTRTPEIDHAALIETSNAAQSLNPEMKANANLSCGCLITTPDYGTAFYSGDNFNIYRETEEGIFIIGDGTPAIFLNPIGNVAYYINSFNDCNSICSSSIISEDTANLYTSCDELTFLNYQYGILYFLEGGRQISCIDSSGENYKQLYSGENISLLSCYSGRLYWISDNILYSMPIAGGEVKIIYNKEPVYFYQFYNNELFCSCSSNILRLTLDGEESERFIIDTFYFSISDDMLFYSSKNGSIRVYDLLSDTDEMIANGLESEPLNLCAGEYMGHKILWFLLSPDGSTAHAYAAINVDSGWVYSPINDLLIKTI